MDGDWLSYREAAERLGVTAENVRHRAIRGRWPRMRGNDGRARVQIPDTLPNPVRTPSERPDKPSVRTPGEPRANVQTIKALEAHVATLREQLAAAETRLAAADARESQYVADLAAERAQNAKAIAAFAALADRFDQLAAERARPWWRRLAG
jgi:hypothetical protein